MRQVIIDFGTLHLFGHEFPLRIYGYGLMLVFGFLLGIFLAQWRAKRAGEKPEHIAHCGLLALLGGVVGARVGYVIQHWDTQFKHSQNLIGDLFDVTSGGLIYYGGLITATAMVLLYLFIKRLPVRRFLDIVAVSLMIGLAFGRAGCFLNGCCYGATCSDKWALGTKFPMYSKPLLKFDGRPDNPFSEGTVDPSPPYSHQLKAGLILADERLMEYGKLLPPKDFDEDQIAVAESTWSRPVKPAQLLGIINALLLAAMLTLFYRVRRREGQVFALLVIMYPITRFMLEMIRDDNPHNLSSGILTHNQYTSILTVAAGIVFWTVLYRLPASAGAGKPAHPAAVAVGARKQKKKHR